MIYHVHVPKCAGGTLLAMLRHVYGNALVALHARDEGRSLTPDAVGGKEAVSGHYPYGVHERLADAHPTYFTFLRDPLERAASMYNYIMYRGRGHAAWRIASTLSPQEFAESGVFDNGMVRQLAGRSDFAWYHQRDPLAAADLWKARLTLCVGMAWVGDVTHFKQDVRRLEQMMGWGVQGIPRINASLSKTALERTPAFERVWAWDLALWDWWTEHRATIQRHQIEAWDARADYRAFVTQQYGEGEEQ